MIPPYDILIYVLSRFDLFERKHGGSLDQILRCDSLLYKVSCRYIVLLQL